MGKLHLIGTLLYYFGLMTMVGGFVLLALGLGTTLASVTASIRAESSGQTGGNPLAAVSNSSSENSLPANIVVGIAGPTIDHYFSSTGFLNPNDEYQGMYYPKFKQFFSFLIVGLLVMVIGVILRAVDELTDFVDKQKKKVDKLKEKSTLYSDAPRSRAEEIMERVKVQ